MFSIKQTYVIMTSLTASHDVIIVVKDGHVGDAMDPETIDICTSDVG